MITLTLAECAKAMAARPWGRIPTISVGNVSIDSRTISARDLFFAIPGERFDGHEFAADAMQRGAVAVVVSAPKSEAVAALLGGLESGPPGLVLEVDDTIAALGRLAAYHRRQVAAEVVAVVGSNGKTTTKAMIHHILSGRLKGRASPKSFNNAIGVPLTLLSAEQGDEYLVVEIGTNAPGEIAQLTALVQPDLAVLTCLGEEHLEGLGNLEGVAAEECSAFRHVRRGGFVAVNVDAPEVQAHMPAAGVHCVTFGRSASADVRLTDVSYELPWLRFTLNERFPFRLRVPGMHNALNAAGAVTIVRRFGLDYAAAAARLESFVPPPMRNEIVEIGGVTIVNDAYNANPQSAVAAIDTLLQIPCRGKRIAVFGEMRELGSQAAELHRKVAERLAGSDIGRVMLVGSAVELMAEAFGSGGLFGPSVEKCRDVDACLERLADGLQPGDVVLLKASRAVELDRLIEPLRTRVHGGL